jgi:hypothetical protein
MSNPLLQLRMYDAEKDHALLVEWCEAHGAQATPPNLLSPLGVVVQQNGQDCAMLFLYYALSAGVAFVDGAATRPKLSAKEAIDCFEFAIEYLRQEARHQGYAVMVANVCPAIARCLSRIGFYRQEEGMVRMFMPTANQ